MRRITASVGFRRHDGLLCCFESGSPIAKNPLTCHDSRGFVHTQRSTYAAHGSPNPSLAQKETRMMNNTKPTQYEKLHSRFLNIRFVAIIALIASIVVALGAFTDSLEKLNKFVASFDKESGLSIRVLSTGVGSMNVRFFVDNESREPTALGRVRVVSSQLAGDNLWKVGGTASWGSRDFEAGDGIIAVNCKEFKFVHELDEIPMEFSTELFEKGTTRKFGCDGSAKLAKSHLNPVKAIYSRIEIWSQGNIIESRELDDWFDSEFWGHVFN